ncbi:MAG TPA: hypothetical protein VMZ28_03895 [Kofleriaceae bacterium]|nr:hypothetical protein [Kofleriaceae bacterium]
MVSPRGLFRVRADGTGTPATLIDHPVALLDVSADGRSYLFRSEDAELFLVGGEGKTVRGPLEVGVGVEDAALSPDGTLLAVVPAADKRTEDDALVIVDARTLAVRVLPAAGSGSALHVVWAEAGDAVRVEFARRVDPLGLKPARTEAVWVQIADGVRTPLEGPPARAAAPRHRPIAPVCGGRLAWAVSWDRIEGIDRVDAEGRPRRLLVLDGTRGSQGELFFAPGCSTVVFGLGGETWVVEVTGAGARALAAGMPLPLPTR